MIHFWDSRSDHNYDAELLLDKLSARCLLADEAVQQLETDRTLSTELRREAIQLATKRGSASYVDLIEAAWTTGVASNLPSSEYTKGLNRATAAVKLVPGHGRSQITFALLQFRSGQFEPALLSAQRAMEIQKSQSADAHAIRAVAYYRLHDTARARSEAAMARQSANQSRVTGDHPLLEEAEALVGK
jgi:tetratricopeptide (TPR) repeat protein